jgi:hypothetical protein
MKRKTKEKSEVFKATGHERIFKSMFEIYVCVNKE